MGEAFLVADFYHGIGGGFLHDCFESVVDSANEEGGIFVCKAAAGSYVSVGVNVENVARALTVVFLEPAASLPCSRVV